MGQSPLLYTVYGSVSYSQAVHSTGNELKGWRRRSKRQSGGPVDHHGGNDQWIVILIPTTRVRHLRSLHPGRPLLGNGDQWTDPSGLKIAEAAICPLIILLIPILIFTFYFRLPTSTKQHRGI
jgi:hypothetical protein